MHFSAVPDVRLKNYSAWTSSHQWSLESSQLGELKYAISARYDLRSKNNSFRKGKIQGEIAKKLQKGQVIRPNVFQTSGRSGLLEERLAYLQKGRYESLSEKSRFMFWPTRKIHQRRCEFSPWVKSCVEWENEKGKGVNSRTNKKANDEWHTWSQVPRLHGEQG